MQIVNIYNNRRTIYLFTRNDKGILSITTETNFYPYFYEPDGEGNYIGYDGTPLKKVLCNEPSDIPKMRSSKSYESDVLFARRYMIDQIDKIDLCPIKYFFIDIEVLTSEIPNTSKPEYPISCISIYNSFSKEIKTFTLLDYDGDEEGLILDFINYFQEEKPDLWLSWNVDFDYNYMCNRIQNFAKRISPINQSRHGQTVDYPAGISILDYLKLFRKVSMREKSYALDQIAQKYFDEKPWGKSDFSKLTKDIVEKNINDVNRMIKIEEKFKLIDYYNEIRILTKCEWEDLYYNSRIVGSLLFEEAKKNKVILPNNPKIEDDEKSTFQGATRDILSTGIFENIGKYDLSGAYPSIIINFCLDTVNIVNSPQSNTVKVEDNYFIQNEDALLPKAVKRILKLKQDIGKQKKETNIDSEDYKLVSRRYDGIKAVVNSCFGVFGNKYFRLYDNRVASSITFLVRELLLFVKNKLNEAGYTVIYWDTDSLFVNSKDNLTDIMNKLITDWANTYNKKSISVSFEREGVFSKIFLLGKCHYYGILENVEAPEIKGMEIKRSSSSKYEAYFQRELIDKILNKESKESIINWIKSEKERIKTLPLEEVAFPSKIQNKEYKTEVTRANGMKFAKSFPIFIRAYENSKIINKKFTIKKGESFYYVYTKSLGKDKNGKIIDVLAFTEEDKHLIDKTKVNWEEMIRRNILMKARNIFDAMKWSLDMELQNQGVLF